ncbi:glycosyltransferase involved in cell wall biosynthesis [Microbacterium resistens]|uniref:D-inositol 3-phosphate glycosyltransferase n=1 Tax=Microbacterium resistens TaxID=156977 RepID=A0ABU1SBV4_9MICO|nr:glycosyltransferase family 4 protein [Microbacterium resistens]MDR6867034.1 glycosyltransferase involved in cell wall biosynthesis [Microbacterium resistens]
MHIVFFGDQHLESLGGAQVSMRLQRRYLERAGHTVTVVAPRMHGPRLAELRRTEPADPAYLDLPSLPITLDREYAMTWPGRRADRLLDRALASRPPVDLVHVQADFWGAFIGHRFAHRHGIPAVHTMHNRVDVGIAAVTPLHRPVLAALNSWRRRALRGIGDQPADGGGWGYLRGIAAESLAVTAPSGHFARRLEEHGVFRPVDVVWNGIDDDVLAEVLSAAPAERSPGRPRFVWLGRMSPEKRLLPFLEAVVASDVDAEVQIVGGGGQLRAAERIAARAVRPGIRFLGRLPYAGVLARMADADAVVQTSIGFETQGMTPFEAATLGTPTVVSDPDIAGELRGGLWAVPDAEGSEEARIAALARTLRVAADDIANGTAPAPDPEVAAMFRQSSRTAAMIEVYERVLRR